MTHAEPPNPIDLGRAANALVGGQRRSDVATEVAVCVALPLLVPALLEVIFRLRSVPNGADIFGLTDIAFGFAAAAIAGMVRSVTLRNEQWRAFIWVAFSILLIEMSVGLAADTVPAWQRLTVDVKTHIATTGQMTGAGRPTAISQQTLRAQMRSEADDATVGRGGILWLIALPFGVLLIVAEVLFILKVR